ncbi:HAD-IIA family hydrolase [Corynebacterium mendelii]|uniref:HAD-IIA family hydrolase n=1 Tax=Corynebacterium mendelii TaxID=2765362 RepID=A0A939DZA6_9CORY|nr:HAD-IIA family hydrolase [Corynebacterium mendelii]MBN9643590.1 HAD-IIA family hydrolase [Corynebacterium mendelii]
MTCLDDFDALFLDCDGTVYEGGRPIDHAREALAHVTCPVMYITNNASRLPSDVAASLSGMGIPATEEQVMTSAMAGVGMLKEIFPAGSVILVLGTDTLAQLVEKAGFTATRTADDHPDGVIHGHSPDTGWAELSEAALAIRAGARYIATNRDLQLPAERGMTVGNGAMVMAVVHSTGVDPQSAGKPAPTMFEQAKKALGVANPLAIGDRLDTDIAGGNNAGQATLQVLTGVSGPQALLTAEKNLRPVMVAEDLRALSEETTALTPQAQDGFTARREGGTIVLSGGDDSSRFIAGLRTVLACAWDGGPVPAAVRADSPAAEKVVARWW